MSCNKPIIAFRGDEENGAGKRPITFSPGGNAHPIALPCGQCMGCGLDRARSWAIRLHLEARQHEVSCFVTLTCSEENIPDANSLVPGDLSRFIKRLRRHIRPTRVRYYGVGEYGGSTERPHYHAIIYGYGFPDRSVYLDRGHYTIGNSLVLSELWPMGHATVQGNSLECAACVSRYAVKRVTGKKSKGFCEGVGGQTGEIYTRTPEFARMSRRPGLGHAWLLKYYKGIYPKGYITSGKGVKIPPPGYFNRMYERWCPEEMEAFRDSRKEGNFKRYIEANTERMEAREIVQAANYKLRTGGSLWYSRPLQ